MVKSYKLKVYANKGKQKELNKLLAFWQDRVNSGIKIFWNFKEIRGSYPPAGYGLGGRLISNASVKAWQIVKGAKKKRQKEIPYFKGNGIDFEYGSAYIIPEFKTKEFDIWFNVANLNLYHRLKIPCKRTMIFNEAVKKGKLKRSFKLIKENGQYHMTCFVEYPEIKKENKKLLGIDVGLNNAIATSDGKILGKELKDLRIRTKHRKCGKKMSPIKQGLNHYAKEMVNSYSHTDFVVENLFFKGKGNRSRKFRRRNNNWAYNHLSNKLEETGKVEGFSLLKVNPAYTSQKCPVCGFTDKMNRRGELFLCHQCGYKGNADVVGAMNILAFGRVIREQFVSLNQIGGINV